MIAKLAAAGAGAGASVLGYGLWEANRFVLREVEVPVLSAGQSPIRVLHISDIHLTTYQKAKLDWVRSLQELEPDLVVNTGDNLSQAQAMEPLLNAWGTLLDRPGVFVFGSNDYTVPRFRNPLTYFAGPSSTDKHDELARLPFDDLRAKLTGRGWADLNHQRATLEVAGRRIAFRGTDDAHLAKDDYSLVSGPAEQDVDLNIAVTHAPYLRLLDAMTDDGMDMIFAGHTHGGQVCLPIKGAIVTNCDLDTGRVKGLSSHNHGGHSSWLHVSAGIGSSPFAPYRVACRPEATLLTLVAE